MIMIMQLHDHDHALAIMKSMKVTWTLGSLLTRRREDADSVFFFFFFSSCSSSCRPRFCAASACDHLRGVISGVISGVGWGTRLTFATPSSSSSSSSDKVGSSYVFVHHNRVKCCRSFRRHAFQHVGHASRQSIRCSGFCTFWLPATTSRGRKIFSQSRLLLAQPGTWHLTMEPAMSDKPQARAVTRFGPPFRNSFRKSFSKQLFDQICFSDALHS